MPARAELAGQARPIQRRALIGALLRANRGAEEVTRLLSILQQVAGAARSHKPEKIVPRLAEMLAAGKPVPGLRRLKELVGDAIALKVAEWLALRRGTGSEYQQRADGIYRATTREDKSGKPVTVEVKLGNFDAEIVEVVTHDDGSGDLRRSFVVTGRHGRVEVPAEEFDSMSWVTEHWGPEAFVMPGRDVKPHCATAIKALSEEVDHHTVYGHTGWRQIDGQWLYLHCGGAIGADGPVEGVSVDIGGELGRAVLPPVTDRLKKAVRTSLMMIELNATLAAAVWRAPLVEFCPIYCSLFDAGPTGTFKSAAQGVAMAHWGAKFDGAHFPANWSSTANAIERTTFLAKDMLCVIDDFAPRGGQRAVAELHGKAEQVLRGAGNLAGRQRLKADASARATYYARGVVAASGEDVPSGHSLRARILINQVAPGDIDPGKLAELQRAGANGLLAEAMAGYVQWLAGAEVGELSGQQQKLEAELREKFYGGGDDHRRTSANVAALQLGVCIFLQFAEAVQAIDEAERQALWQQAAAAMRLGGVSQRREQQDEDPVRQFLDAVPAVLAAGMAHLAGRDGGQPQIAQR